MTDTPSIPKTTQITPSSTPRAGSGHLRQQLGPANRTLALQLQSCKNLGSFTVDGNLTKEQNRKLAEEFLSKGAPRLSALSSTQARTQRLVDQWTRLMDILAEEGNIAAYDVEQDIFADFCQNNLLNNLSEADEVIAATREKLDLTALIERSLRETVSTSSTAPVAPTANMASLNLNPAQYGRPNMNLPRLQLPKFAGETSSWTYFIDYFDATIHSNQGLTDVEKLSYLMGQLHGEAREAVKTLAPTSSNYAIARQILSARFGDATTITTRLMDELTKLRLKGSSTIHVKSFANKLDQLRRQLQQHAVTISSEHFESILENNLPRTIRKELHALRRHRVVWNVEAMVESLFEVIAEQEALDNGPQEKLTRPSNARSIPQTRTLAVRNTPRRSTFHSSDVVQSPAYKDTQSRTTWSCIFCDQDHPSSRCQDYNTTQKRRERLLEKRRCLRCLQPYTQEHACQKLCFHCKGKHNSLLCTSKTTHEQSVNVKTNPKQRQRNLPASDANATLLGQARTYFTPINNPEAPVNETVTMVAEAKAVNSNITPSNLPIISVTVKNPETNQHEELYALLDTGSEISYISKSAVEKLKLTPIGYRDVKIETFGGETQEVEKGRLVTATLNDHYTVQLLEFPQLMHTTTIIRRGRNDNIYEQVVTPSILIGSDYIFRFLPIEQGNLGAGLVQFDTKLGEFIIRQQDQLQNCRQTRVFTNIVRNDSDEQLQQFWSLEQIGIGTDHQETVNQEVEQRFEKEIQFKERYYVRWLWNGRESELPTNFSIAYYRLVSMMKRLQTDEILKAKYRTVFDEQEKDGIIEKVVSNVSDGIISYVPHQAVTSHKFRVVYDCSAKMKNGISINDVFHQGPLLLPQLVGLLLRFRLGKYVVISDIKKAFLQIGLQKTERDVVRFLLPKDWNRPVDSNNIQVYRFARVLFGATCSPSLLAMTIRHHLKQYDGGEELLRDIYVDNLVETADDISELETRCFHTKSIFADAKLELREYYANDEQLHRKFNLDEESEGTVTKVLGHLWDYREDFLTMSWPKWNSNVMTKRAILSFIASIYNPMGLISPAILPLKRFLQQLWMENVTWDQNLTATQAEKWIDLTNESGNSMQIQRMVAAKTVPIDLAVFCDASQHAFGIATYAFNEITPPRLIYAKSRLFPAKSDKNSKLTIPRKELTALLCAVRAVAFLRKELKIHKTTIFSDSQVALSQITHRDDQTVYVRNRVEEIQKLAQNITFRFVPTEANPSDLASRGTRFENLLTSVLWWEGPTFLSKVEENWPKDIVISLANPCDEGKLEQTTKCNIILQHQTHKEVMRDCCWSTAVAAMKMVIKFCNKLKRLQNYTESLESAEKLLIRPAQDQYPPNSTIQKRHQMIREEGVWYIQTRIDDAALQGNSTLLWLPPEAKITSRIIQHYHELCNHQNAMTTTAEIRNRYWISYRLVKFYIKRCIKCRIHTAKSFGMPIFPKLPETRTQIGKAFGMVGLDVAGPLQTTTGPAFFLLLTCLKVRAVHLEILPSMKSEEILNALIKFMARRGVPEYFLSDRATYFVAARKLILLKYGASKNIYWHHTTPHAPFRGGAYERLNHSVKTGIRQSIGRRKITYRELDVLLTAIEATLNNRPLIPVTDDADNHGVLRPVDFLRPNTENYSSELRQEMISEEELKDPDFVIKQTKIDDLRKLNLHLNNSLEEIILAYSHQPR